MFSDYYLTLAGKKLREKIYANHFTSDEYELNPAWQKDVNKFKLFNYKHVLAVILVTGYFYFASLLLNDNVFFLLYGAVFVLYASIIMRHLQNILIFRYANKNPGLLSGKIYMNHIFSLKTSLYQTLTTGILIFLLFLWTQSLFLLGGSIGLLLFCLTQLRWIRSFKRKMSQKAQSTPPPESTA